ncbi:hypothetical protein RRG08_046361 [Elysia crispata]|uniref:Uncharacterized protein n=1 Tax=Elysia crispata TaxID=231223 RepID=A0AAE1A4E0_9GAST|nr:hypothetical protein RRG08_046361 [Elysia crispata]
MRPDHCCPPVLYRQTFTSSPPPLLVSTAVMVTINIHHRWLEWTNQQHVAKDAPKRRSVSSPVVIHGENYKGKENTEPWPSGYAVLALENEAGWSRRALVSMGNTSKRTRDWSDVTDRDRLQTYVRCERAGRCARDRHVWTDQGSEGGLKWNCADQYTAINLNGARIGSSNNSLVDSGEFAC